MAQPFRAASEEPEPVELPEIPEGFESIEEAELVQLLGGPLEIYCERLLKVIHKKGGQADALRFNRVQTYVHGRLEAQLQTMRMVRALVLKGRQQGVSTYVAARFFRKVHALPGISAYILSHEDKSTQTLFNHPKRFYSKLPENIQPEIGRAGKDILSFSKTGSQYQVGTAGAKETGRSTTNQLFHGSEVAFWPNAEDHMSASLQSVPPAPGTEIILESTANGIGGPFHEMWLKAEAGHGDYIAIFVPWYWQEEYSRSDFPAGWRPIEEELEMMDLYDLTMAQAYWMHLKNLEMGGSPGVIYWKFKQDYPCNAEEAFQSGGGEGLIRSAQVVRARKNSLERKGPDGEIIPPIEVDPMAPRLLGVDCARNITNGDKTHLIDRCGRVAGSLINQEMATDNTMAIVGAIIHADDQFHFDRIFIDIGGCGSGVYDRLLELGWGSRVTPVSFGSESLEPKKFKNKRAEIHWKGREWFDTPGGVSIPFEDLELHRHLCASNYTYTSQDQIIVEPKEKIRKRLKLSPDRADALLTTFAERVIKASTTISLRRLMPRRPRGNAALAR
jgi:hypothetical protein